MRSTNGEEFSAYLSEAVKLADSKKWYLESKDDHPVVDRTTAKSRPEIHRSVDLYLEAKSSKRTQAF
jgi:hypothetical protein